MKLTLPFEDRRIKPGQEIMLHEPAREEHYVTRVTHEARDTKIVTIVEATPYHNYDGGHREELEGRQR